MRRRSYLPALSLLAVTLFAAAPAAAQFEVQEVELVPGAPTWQDELVVHIDLVSSCIVGENDEIEVEETFEPGVGQILVVTVPTACIRDPALPEEFSRTVVLGRLTPGDYLLRIQSDEEEGQHEESFAVHPVGQLLVTFPGEPVTDAAPFTIRVGGLAGCGIRFGDPTVEPGRVLEIIATTDCPILPPGLRYTEAEVEVGPLQAGDWEVRVFDTDFGPPFPLVRRQLTVYDDQVCVPSDTLLCLNDDRFRVFVGWSGFQGGSGSGHAIPLADRDDTGMFWFFDEDNVELTVKVLDGCGVNGHYWVFVSSGSTVEYTVTVVDSAHPDQSRTYHNPLGETPELIPDTAAFETCP